MTLTFSGCISTYSGNWCWRTAVRVCCPEYVVKVLLLLSRHFLRRFTISSKLSRRRRRRRTRVSNTSNHRSVCLSMHFVFFMFSTTASASIRLVRRTVSTLPPVPSKMDKKELACHVLWLWRNDSITYQRRVNCVSAYACAAHAVFLSQHPSEKVPLSTGCALDG